MPALVFANSIISRSASVRLGKSSDSSGRVNETKLPQPRKSRKTSIKRFQASESERGCVLDFVDYPLDNR
jgi:hypothetical protein